MTLRKMDEVSVILAFSIAGAVLLLLVIIAIVICVLRRRAIHINSQRLEEMNRPKKKETAKENQKKKKDSLTSRFTIKVVKEENKNKKESVELEVNYNEDKNKTDVDGELTVTDIDNLKKMTLNDKKMLKGLAKAAIFYGSAICTSVAFTMLPYINEMIVNSFGVILLSTELLNTLSSVAVLGIVVSTVVVQAKKYTSSSTFLNGINAVIAVSV